MTSVFSLLNPKNYGDEALAEIRMDICLNCDRLRKETKQCKECGCFMYMKVKLQDATCPLGKW